MQPTIGPLKTFHPIIYPGVHQPTQPLYRKTPAEDTFQARFSATLKAFGESYTVPDDLLEKLNGVKLFLTPQEEPHAFQASNAVRISPNHLIGTAHVVNGNTAQSARLGSKEPSDPQFSLASSSIKAVDEALDLSLIETDQPSKAASTQAMFELADTPPKVGDQLYILGVHSQIGGPHLFPARCITKGRRLDDTIPLREGKDASYFRIESSLFKDKPFNPQGYSGAAILNEKGQLAGLLGLSLFDAQDLPAGLFEVIDAGTIRRFLRGNPIDTTL